MERRAFTREQAEEIAEDFEDLIDTDIKVADDSYLTVTHVTACPYSEQDKAVFIDKIITESVPPASLLENHAGNNFDVIIIACDIDNNSIYEVTDIRSYIAQNGIQYNFPD